MNRRAFLRTMALAPVATILASRSLPGAGETAIRRGARLLFVSQGRTAMINSDGTGLHYFEFNMPNQATWQPGPLFPDGRRLIFLSMEPRRDGPGKPFEEYYTQTPTHLWQYDLERTTLTELATKERLAVFYTPALLLGEDRLLVQVVRNRVGQIFSMNLDGTDAREFTRAGEGLPYGLSLSPDGKRVAFHLASPDGYQVWTSNADGAERIRVAADPNHLYFGTSWSPDGRWILYQDCHFKEDPGHDWSDICIGRADGTETRVLTSGQVHWFGATYGDRANRGGGSNMPAWISNGQILFSRKLQGAKVAWEYQPQRPDTDHFNREFKIESARGGTEICRLDPGTGTVTRLTQSQPAAWDFRPAESPDRKQIVFCRAPTGAAPSIWVMEKDGGNPRLIARGLEDRGADHPRWLG